LEEYELVKEQAKETAVMDVREKVHLSADLVYEEAYREATEKAKAEARHQMRQRSPGIRKAARLNANIVSSVDLEDASEEGSIFQDSREILGRREQRFEAASEDPIGSASFGTPDIPESPAMRRSLEAWMATSPESRPCYDSYVGAQPEKEATPLIDAGRLGAVHLMGMRQEAPMVHSNGEILSTWPADMVANRVRCLGHAYECYADEILRRRCTGMVLCSYMDLSDFLDALLPMANTRYLHRSAIIKAFKIPFLHDKNMRGVPTTQSP